MIKILLRESMSCKFSLYMQTLRIEVYLSLMIMSHPCANGEEECNIPSYGFTDSPLVLPFSEKMDHAIMTLDHSAFPSLDDHVS